MASQSVRLRPYTFFARLPRGVTNVDLCKILVTRFTKAELGGVQDFSAGRFEVVFKTKAAVDRFLADPVVEVKEEKVKFEYRGSRAKTVRIFQYPLEESDEELKRVLVAYGTVHAMQRETIPGFADFWSGTRRVRMDMQRPVPNLLRLLDRYVARCEYEGVVHQCVRCGGTGHYAAACSSPKCSRCEQFGHETCDAPCAVCQADHARSECRVKSFAAALTGRRAAIATANAPTEETSAASDRAAPSEQGSEGESNSEGKEGREAPAVAPTTCRGRAPGVPAKLPGYRAFHCQVRETDAPAVTPGSLFRPAPSDVTSVPPGRLSGRPQRQRAQQFGGAAFVFFTLVAFRCCFAAISFSCVMLK